MINLSSHLILFSYLSAEFGHPAVTPYSKLRITSGPDDPHGKVNILLQAYVSNSDLNSFSLISDAAYVAQNAGRIARALFEVSVRNGWPLRAARLLTMCRAIDRRVWPTDSPLRQVCGRVIDICWRFSLCPDNCSDQLTPCSTPVSTADAQLGMLTPEIIMKIEERKLRIDALREMSASDIGNMLRHPKMGERVRF